MRFNEFKTPKIRINEAAPAAIVAAWPWLLGLFGAAGASTYMQQNPEKVEQLSKSIEKGITVDPRTMTPADKKAVVATNSPVISALSDAWDWLTKSDEPTQAEIDKRVDDALASAAQTKSGKQTQDILQKYTPGKVDPALQKAANAEREKHEKLVNKIISTPKDQTTKMDTSTIPSIIGKRTTPDVAASKPDDTPIITKRDRSKGVVSKPDDTPIITKRTTPDVAASKPDDTPIITKRTTPDVAASKPDDTPIITKRQPFPSSITQPDDISGKMIKRGDQPIDIPDATDKTIVKPAPGEAPSAKGRDVVPPAGDVAQPGIARPGVAQPGAATQPSVITQPSTVAQPGAIAEPITGQAGPPVVIPPVATLPVNNNQDIKQIRKPAKKVTYTGYRKGPDFPTRTY